MLNISMLVYYAILLDCSTGIEQNCNQYSARATLSVIRDM